MVPTFCIVVATLVALCTATSTSRKMKLHEKRDVPAEFEFISPASPDTLLDLRIALVQSDPGGLAEAVYDVSTPSSPNYGQYLSKEDAARFVSPTPESLAVVTDWLQNNEIDATTLTPAGDWISINVPVSKANDLFDADFSVFVRSSSGEQTVRTLEYSIPQELLGHLAFIYPTVTFPISAARPFLYSTSTESNSAAAYRRDSTSCTIVTPTCLQYMYGIPTTPATQSTNQLAISGFNNDWAREADLAMWLGEHRTDMSNSTTFSLETLDGGSNTQTPGSANGGADLAIQYSVGLATNVPITYVSVGTNNSDDLGGFLDEANYFLAADVPPQVVSTGYGFNENDLTVGLADNLCNAYAQLAARGVTLLFASGDGGIAGGVYDQICGNINEFTTTFPSGCPFVTSVGGTEGNYPESGSSFSSGGFSNFFGIPSYQAEAMANFSSEFGNTEAGMYNTSGRGYPDVSASSVTFQVVVNGTRTVLSGTSASSTVFASIIALLNDELIAAGKPQLGFLNPWLYANFPTAGRALNDIYFGSNPGCTSSAGFSALRGWDPVTGLGTPIYEYLRIAAGL